MSKDKFTRAGILAVLTTAGIETHQARKLTAHIIEALATALAEGKVIELRGLGTLEPRERKARRRFNPRTMSPVDIPARCVVFFKPAKNLKIALSGRGEGSPV
jgi:DNA-binding protein HU-beta